jgi:hypothetical protein
MSAYFVYSGKPLYMNISFCESVSSVILFLILL